jgi:Tfp pilus assembly protein PilV
MIFKKNKGLTLIEIIIAVLLSSIILGAVFSVLSVARTLWKTGCSQLNVQQEGRKGIFLMMKELRQAESAAISGVPPDGTNYNSITFHIPDSISETGIIWSGNIQYSLGGLNNTQLLRSQSGTQRVLANNISAVNFSRDAAAPDIVTISVTARKYTFPGFSTSESYVTLSSKAEARN